MSRVAKFEKVSLEQFKNDMKSVFHEEISDSLIENIYSNIKLPKRATVDSAGYDFYTPINIDIDKGVEVKVPTGIRVKIEEGWFLGCYPRSGLGFKSMRLLNTVGIIDSLYYNSDNEGHIMAKITSDHPISLYAGDRFMQGIFQPFGITYDDETKEKRNGGFGSSGA